MPISTYHGETFLAFVDISGFKEMMKSRDRAIHALNHFYSSGFEILQHHENVNGFFISDCGVMFVRGNDTAELRLKSLLRVVEEINRRLLAKKIMLTTSIAYGPFNYQERIEFLGIQKDMLYGNAYLVAYLDNAAGKPKLLPGQCRLVRGDYDFNTFNMDNRVQLRKNEFYFYWMVDNPTEINAFEESYQDAYTLKYQGMLEALRIHCKIR